MAQNFLNASCKTIPAKISIQIFSYYHFFYFQYICFIYKLNEREQLIIKEKGGCVTQ